MMSLKTYRQKRVFEKTPEPKGKKAAQKGPLLFCVQKHAATSLHYDFRLEYKGILLSWAVPKGPSLNPQEKHLAIHVEDHPLEYRNFEGVIPKGNYGAGTVIIWDEGTYTIPGLSTRASVEKAVGEGLKAGKIEIELFGKKLKGIFALIKLKKDDNSWLLIKKKDDFATTEDILLESDSVRGRKKKVLKLSERHLAKKLKMPRTVKPMLATLIDEPFDNKDWVFEMKWDGYRALAYVEKRKVELLSRNQNSFNQLFPPIVAELKKASEDVLLDGEVVILDKEGRSQFQLMQNYQRTRQGNLFYFVFDLLFYKGYDLRSLPLIERKEILKEFITSQNFERVRFSEFIEGKGSALFREAAKHDLEGIIGKNKQSFYISGRSREWVKIKTHLRQEAVIGGFTAPRGSRKKLGALLLGVYEGDKLHYIGHAGGGFDSRTLEEVYQKLLPLIQEKSPFIKEPKPNAAVTWVKPKLVCEISFSEWTDEGIARQPIFEGLRLDKKPKNVFREKPATK